ncbi:hypothetical protein CBR_g79910 [Chara braunii]|uniref:RRM domain-containing protein n=1 Tax=Chara braunii TaxID=69332 RepID=A0A388JKY7_CHABU|nr:hypothetical protein CBR_g79910 [Chara braunii]|eukprot:GBG46512.1 hypothetical protein CBR_g79910 [Chara braunii]
MPESNMEVNLNRGGISADAGKRPGWVAKPSTFKDNKWVHTSRTLYITNVAPGTGSEELEGLFRHLDGFLAFRRVRSMCFVDFSTKQQATSAMWQTHGHKFKPSDEGLLVSYDKDDTEERGGWSIRKREENKRKRKEVESTRVLYRCSACGHFCFKLARILSEMPERKTDNSRVVEVGKDLCSLVCAKGGTKLLKRDKGVEKQYRYNCELCDLCVGYRPVPYEMATKYIYIFPEAVKATTVSETEDRASDEQSPTRGSTEQAETGVGEAKGLLPKPVLLLPMTSVPAAAPGLSHPCSLLSSASTQMPPPPPSQATVAVAPTLPGIPQLLCSSSARSAEVQTPPVTLTAPSPGSMSVTGNNSPPPAACSSVTANEPP